jgi:hypothetical protein
MVLKKIGAILLPMQMPPVRLLGTLGMSTPMYHRMELVADLREEPVPRGLHSFTCQLKVSAFCGIGGACRACLGVV